MDNDHWVCFVTGSIALCIFIILAFFYLVTFSGILCNVSVYRFIIVASLSFLWMLLLKHQKQLKCLQNECEIKMNLTSFQRLVLWCSQQKILFSIPSNLLCLLKFLMAKIEWSTRWIYHISLISSLLVKIYKLQSLCTCLILSIKVVTKFAILWDLDVVYTKKKKKKKRNLIIYMHSPHLCVCNNCFSGRQWSMFTL
jgi:hypothetical protein